MTAKNMMRHNLSAVEKVKQSLLTKDRAAVVHATGTGKSYIYFCVSENIATFVTIETNVYGRQERAVWFPAT